MRIPRTISTTTVGRISLRCHRDSTAPSVDAQEHEDDRAALLPRQLGGEREVEHVVERERHDLARVRAGRGAADALTVGDSCEIEIRRAPPPLAHRLVESSELA